MGILQLFSVALNILGVALGALGSYLIWRHGIPAREVREAEGFHLMLEDYDANVRDKALARARKRSTTGFVVLIGAFAFQLMGNILLLADWIIRT